MNETLYAILIGVAFVLALVTLIQSKFVALLSWSATVGFGALLLQALA